MDRLFGQLKQKDLLAGRAFDDFATDAAEFLADLNAIHPFRDGNGRTQLSFLHLLAIKAGHELDLSRIRPETFLKAMIASFGGAITPLARESATLRI